MIEIDMPVHPAAAVFPMLSEHDMADLAEHIKANGLIYPITLDADGRIVAGRNRYVACKMAGVEPTFTTLNGHDPIAYILGENDQRRHQSVGQRAMAVAMVENFSSEILDHGQKQAAADAAGIRRARVSQARTVLVWAADLAPLVLEGSEHLDAAYQKARARKQDAESAAKADERQRAEVEAKTGALKAEAPDLAGLVAEWRMSLEDAWTVLEKRRQEKREAQRRHVRYMVESTTMLRTLLYRPATEILDEWADGVAVQQAEGPFAEQVWTPDGLRQMAADLGALADEMARRGEG